MGNSSAHSAGCLVAQIQLRSPSVRPSVRLFSFSCYDRLIQQLLGRSSSCWGVLRFSQSRWASGSLRSTRSQHIRCLIHLNLLSFRLNPKFLSRRDDGNKPTGPGTRSRASPPVNFSSTSRNMKQAPGFDVHLFRECHVQSNVSEMCW